MTERSEATPPRRVFPFAEAAAVVALLALVALISVPDVLGAAERGRHDGCLEAIHAVDDELLARMKAFAAAGHVAPADAAIEATLARVRTAGGDENPRRIGDVGYVHGLDPQLVPPPGSSCRVFLVDDTAATPSLTPAVVVTAFERGVHAHRLSLR